MIEMKNKKNETNNAREIQHTITRESNIKVHETIEINRNSYNEHMITE